MKNPTIDTSTIVDEQLIHILFEQQAKLTPQKTAIRFDNQYLTYKALNRSSNQLAHYLRAIGVQTGTMVAISVERSLEMMIGILGILKAGGVYVPIDPSYPNERIQYILEDTTAPILLTQKHLAEKFPFVEHTICFETDWLNILNYSTRAPDIHISPNDLAYIIYTSGSTGNPKELWSATKTCGIRLLPDCSTIPTD